MARPNISREIALVRDLCRDLGMGEVAPILLKTAHHTSLLIPSLDIVARVGSATPIGDARSRALRELAVTRHLARRGASAIAPIAEEAGPHVTAGSIVTFWPYIEQVEIAGGEIDATTAAGSLSSLHVALADYRGRLPRYTDALDRCCAVLEDEHRSGMLTRHDRTMLRSHVLRLRDQTANANEDRWCALHGDVHAGNLLNGPSGPLWIDFEDSCRGPREYDIAGLPREVWPRFAGADIALVEAFADLKSVCVAIWCSAAPSRSAEIDEAAAYHLDRIRLW